MSNNDDFLMKIFNSQKFIVLFSASSVVQFVGKTFVILNRKRKLFREI